MQLSSLPNWACSSPGQSTPVCLGQTMKKGCHAVCTAEGRQHVKSPDLKDWNVCGVCKEHDIEYHTQGCTGACFTKPWCMRYARITTCSCYAAQLQFETQIAPLTIHSALGPFCATLVTMQQTCEDSVAWRTSRTWTR